MSPDIFDQVADGAASPQAQQSKGDIFDHVAEGGDIFDQVAQPQKNLYLRTMDTVADASGKVTDAIRTGVQDVKEGAVSGWSGLGKAASNALGFAFVNPADAVATSMGFPGLRQAYDERFVQPHEQRIQQAQDTMAQNAQGSNLAGQIGHGVAQGVGQMTTLPADIFFGRALKAAVVAPEALAETPKLFEWGKGLLSQLPEYIPKGMKADERLYWEEIRKKDLDDPQMARELAKTYQSTAGKALSETMRVSMVPFGVTERFNRLSTLLAGYRMARESGFSHAEAMERAQLASDRAHGVYGREAMPEVTWGTNAGAQAAQAAYIYQKYAHNTFLLMADVLGKKDARSFMHLLAAPMVLAGDKAGTAWLGYLGAKALLAAVSPDDKRDPRERFLAWTREVLGETSEKVARSGLLGWLLGVDVSGSMDTAIRMPKKLEDLGGAPWGVVKDFFGEHGAAHYLSTGQPGKTLEKVLPTGLAKPLQAMRESREGVTDSRGVRLVDEQGKPYRPTEEETWAKAVGFRPQREARVRDITEAARTEERDFQERRQAIFEEYRAWANGGKDPEALTGLVETIRQFNADVDRMDRPNISPITRQGLETQLVNMESPNRKELGRVGINAVHEYAELSGLGFDRQAFAPYPLTAKNKTQSQTERMLALAAKHQHLRRVFGQLAWLMSQASSETKVFCERLEAAYMDKVKRETASF